MNYPLVDITRTVGPDASLSGEVGALKKIFLSIFWRFRAQLLGGLLFAVLLPYVFIKSRTGFDLEPGSLEWSVIGTSSALIIGAFVAHRFRGYPGVQGTLLIIPLLVAAYIAVVLVFFFLRLDYSRAHFLSSCFIAVFWFSLCAAAERRHKRPILGLLPQDSIADLDQIPGVEWRSIEDSETLPDVPGVVADLRAELDPAWERMLARCALAGIPIYHIKYVRESLTGRVEIEHLSENYLGSLIPSSIYREVKRFLDLALFVVAAPVLLVVLAVAALLIKFDDGGPVFFLQPRIGLGGRPFTMIKLRTMKVQNDGPQVTVSNDDRITRIGRILRKFRIDEIPQMFNVLRGDMSWIGPRPEPLNMAEAYERIIPFYSYRHIVRPGISGWAQITQGYAEEVEATTSKLHYDFYYIKNFSLWLDLLIVARTLKTIATGFGSR